MTTGSSGKTTSGTALSMTLRSPQRGSSGRHVNSAIPKSLPEWSCLTVILCLTIRTFWRFARPRGLRQCRLSGELPAGVGEGRDEALPVLVERELAVRDREDDIRRQRRLERHRRQLRRELGRERRQAADAKAGGHEGKERRGVLQPLDRVHAHLGRRARELEQRVRQRAEVVEA